MTVLTKKDHGWYHGLYEVVNKEKYVGLKKPFYRSSWECRFMSWCDNNPNVIKWSFESIEIPYVITENGFSKSHRYIPDFYVEILNKQNQLKKFLVEIKPYNQGPIKNSKNEVYVPKPPKNKNAKALKRYYLEMKTYKKNTLKWNAARSYCQRNGLEFVILTKENLF